MTEWKKSAGSGSASIVGFCEHINKALTSWLAERLPTFQENTSTMELFSYFLYM